MKKYSFIAIVVLAALMAAACSRSGKLSPEADENAWMYDETLPVPIRLGGSDVFSLQTKAFDGQITSFNDLPIRVCAVDLNLGTNFANVGWDADKGYCTGVTTFEGDDDDKLFMNVRAKVTSQNNVVFLGSGDAEMSRYYPYSETQKIKVDNLELTKSTGKNYSFIAYYSPSAAQAPSVDANNVLYKTFALLPAEANPANNIDVLWGRVDAQPIFEESEWNGYYQGFNARYIRTKRATDAQYTPVLKFQHVTSCIHIFVRAENQAARESWNGNAGGTTGDVTVNNLKIAPKIPYVKMNLLTGELSLDESKGKKPTTYYDYDTTVDIHPIEANTEYSTGFFVMPGARTTDDKISITFTIAINGGENKDQTVELPLPTYNDGYSDVVGYQAGVEYNYYINVKALVESEIKASLSTWDPNSGAAQLGPGIIDLE